VEDFQTIVWIVVGVIWLISSIRNQLKAKSQQPPAQELTPAEEVEWDDVWKQEPALPQAVGAVVELVTPEPAAPATPSMSAERLRIKSQVDRLIADAEQLVVVARVDWATMRVAQTIDDFVLPHAKLIKADAERIDESELYKLRAPFDEVEFVYSVIETMIQQRRNPALRKDLGDADQLASACYQPIIDFATAGRIHLSTSTPVTMLAGKSDLGILTGFIPTGIAPIFLPPYFLKKVVWWPALAHEVAHDFLAAATGAEARMRAQLGLPSEEVGLLFLNIGHEGLTFDELYKIFGGWFEEIFCDVFGTLMIGPAYGYTMVELFASPADPAAVSRINIDARGDRLAPHPPRHLRLKTVANILSAVGEDEAAEELVAEWQGIHGVPETIDLPLRGGGAVTVPMGIMEELLGEVCSRLYREQMHGLNGHALFDIPGVDYGPHEAAEVRRAKNEFILGNAPTEHSARAVIGGLVLAWRQAMHREAEFLALAHHAIVGVTEHHEDIHDNAFDIPTSSVESTPGDQPSTVEALVLHTLLGPPHAVRDMARRRGQSNAAVGSGIVNAAHTRWRR